MLWSFLHYEYITLSFLFSVVVLAHGCSRSRLHIFGKGVEPLTGFTRMGAVIFGPSSHPRVSCPTNLSFLFSIPEFLPTNHSHKPICCWYISIFNMVVCCYPDRDLRNTTVHLPVGSFPTITPLFLPLFHCLEFSYHILLDMILNNEEWGVLLYCHRSQVYSGPKW